MAAAPADQVPAWLTALIAGLAVILGAAVTAGASVVAANRKIREVELSYQHRLQETYLENARKYTESVYVPIALALSALSGKFEQFRIHRDVQGGDPAALQDFRDALAEFSSAIGGLQGRGATAFMTTALETELEIFQAFVTSSQTATATLKQAIVRYSVLGMATEGVVRSSFLIRYIRSLAEFSVLLSALPIYARVELVRNQTLAASPQSRDFEKEFVTTVARLRTLIKEVTLGAHARS